MTEAEWKAEVVDALTNTEWSAEWATVILEPSAVCIAELWNVVTQERRALRLLRVQHPAIEDRRAAIRRAID